ncbi:hypothetical protein CVT25_015929 [Psilocybe cyanescens]|uniref:Uncharacterized protein n=1 Tax=Psilocybe cyanescens TaxID=93625 RepID=A0A409WSH1_PSICY|nr:hypothetical protein CVT25_015929 [Psilocybe cyanescens]
MPLSLSNGNSRGGWDVAVWPVGLSLASVTRKDVLYTFTDSQKRSDSNQLKASGVWSDLDALDSSCYLFSHTLHFARRVSRDLDALDQFLTYTGLQPNMECARSGQPTPHTTK